MKGLYIHIPFCSSICFYCDFKRSIYDKTNVDKYLLELKKEIIKKNVCDIDTIYIGGGTPSCLNVFQLKILLEMLQPYAEKIKEYTIESNIESLSIEKIKLLKQYGVNRISLGVQSLQDDLLEYMNRKHRKQDVLKKIEEIYINGIKNISIDLIYGFDKQTLSQWETDLKEIVAIPYISHLSIYSLTIEENSIFNKMNITNCDNDMEAKMYDTAIHILEDNNFKQYEIANFAKDGFQSLHNIHYWHYDDFYGIGLGASGKDKNVRYSNDGSIQNYIDNQVIVNKEVLSKKDMMFEQIMMSLRLREGLNIEMFNQRYNTSFLELYEKVIKKLLVEQKVEIKNGYFMVNRKSMFCLHDLLIEFMED